MDSNILFDHIYTYDSNHSFLEKLKDTGFIDSGKMVEHPGKHFCRFIDFSTPKGNRVYLEFIDVGKGGDPVRAPGISFRYKKNLKGFHRNLEKRASLESHIEHKNYDWKLNSVDELPGWNFLTFKKLGFKTIYPWFTEYDGFKEKPPAQNANKVDSLLGGLLLLNSKGKKFIEELFNQEVGEGFRLSDGTYWQVKPSRINRIREVHLGKVEKYLNNSCSNLDSNRVRRIKNPTHNFWDICIYEN